MINKLMTAALTVVVTLGMAGMIHSHTVAAVEDNAPGNNGTLKVHEFGTPSGTENNDPKVCNFNFEAFNLDANQTGTVTIEAHGNTAAITPVSVSLATDENGNGSTAYVNSLANGLYKATLDNKFGTAEGEKAKSKVFKVECEGGRGEVGVPDSAVSLVCPANTYTLTVANTGTTVLSVKINGVNKMIAVGAPAISADFKAGDVLTVLVDGQPAMVQGKVLNNLTLPTCAGGMGSVRGLDGNSTTVTVAGTATVSSGFGAGAATDVTSLPVTSGGSTQLASVIAMFGSVLATAGVYAARARTGFAL